MTTNDQKKQLIYFGDPMCSWCYGFAPVLDAVSEHFGDRLPVGLVLGGLRPGTKNSLTDKDKQEIKSHWEHVHEASGQPFDFSFFDRDGFIYDTEPASRAVVTFRRENPGQAQHFFAALQSAFYGGGADITKPDVLAKIASENGQDQDEFLELFNSPASHEETMRDFLMAQEAGIRGFPTLIAGSNADGFEIVTHGYRPLDGMIEQLEIWLEGPEKSDTVH